MDDRFWAKVDRSGGADACWPWQACCMERGYGRFRFSGKIVDAQRVAWILTFGPIPEGMDVLHSCDNPPCCNTRHLFLGTDADNVADMVAKGRQGNQQKTCCPARHPYNEENTYINVFGGRVCRICQRLQSRENTRQWRIRKLAGG